jgi:hypothetical protein
MQRVGRSSILRMAAGRGPTGRHADLVGGPGRPTGGRAPETTNAHAEWPGRSRWRCRESNPGPPLLHVGFSVRSPLCLYSDPPVMRTSRCDDPSRCLMFPSTPRPGGRVSPLNDAGFRGGDAPGPTEVYSVRPRERAETEQPQCDWCRHLFFCDVWLTRSSSPSSARFPTICFRSRNRSPPRPAVWRTLQGNASRPRDHPGSPEPLGELRQGRDRVGGRTAVGRVRRAGAVQPAAARPGPQRPVDVPRVHGDEEHL